MSLTLITEPLARRRLSELVFKGEILHFQQIPAMNDFCYIARKILRNNLSSHTPVTAHRKFSSDELITRLTEYQNKCREDIKLTKAFKEVLSTLKFDLNDTYWDRFIFRSIPPKLFNHSGAHSHVNLHRDTWGGNIYQQLNWWAPIYPLAQNRTIAFFPDYWNKPIKNSTTSWRLSELRDARRQASSLAALDYPEVPEVFEEPQCKPFRPVIKPGDLLCFSAAHLHGSVPNTSDFTRYSFETRTVSISDIESKLSAPNVDNEGTEQMTALFSQVNTGAKLTQQVPLTPLLKGLVEH